MRPVLRLHRLSAAALLAAALGVGGCAGASANRQMTLVLDFTPNAAHVGIYEALATGRDRAHGIRLTVRQPTATSDSLKLLSAGRADIAVADIHDLGLARQRGEDLVGIGALVQRPLAAVIAGAAVRRPRELEGQTVGVTGAPSDEAVLHAVIAGDGGDARRVHELTIGFSAVPSLIARRVAAATAFWDVEGVTLRRQGVATHEFRVDAYGAPRYPELVLVARRDELRAQPQRLRAALAALAEGTRAALAHPAAAVALVARASAADPTLVRAELDALRSALTPAITLDSRSLRAWGAWDVRFGILASPPKVADAFALGLAPRSQWASREAR